MGEQREIIRLCFDLCDRGEPAAASELVEQAVREFPDDGALWQLNGIIRHDRGDFDGARKALETASLLVPLNPGSRCALAGCYARAGRQDLARDLYRHVAESDDCPTALLPAVASGLGSVGDDAKALEVCREISRREPASDEALFGAAFYMRRLAYPSEMVIAVVMRAHEIAPMSISLRRSSLASANIRRRRTISATCRWIPSSADAAFAG